MREYRSSGSVEGVMSNHDSYSDWNLALAPPLLFRGRTRNCTLRSRSGCREDAFLRRGLTLLLAPE